MKLEGNFIIMKNGKMYVDNIELKDNDEVYLKVKKIRQIIADAKECLI